MLSEPSVYYSFQFHQHHFSHDEFLCKLLKTRKIIGITLISNFNEIRLLPLSYSHTSSWKLLQNLHTTETCPTPLARFQTVKTASSARPTPLYLCNITLGMKTGKMSLDTLIWDRLPTMFGMQTDFRLEVGLT